MPGTPLPTEPDPQLSEENFGWDNEPAPDPALSEDTDHPANDPPPALGNLRFPDADKNKETDIAILEREAKQLEITAKEVREEASRRLIKASTLRKKRQLEMEVAVKPLLAQEVRLRMPFQLDIGVLKAIETHLAMKISTWDRAELARAKELQAKQNLKIEQQNAERAQEAEAKGLPAPMVKAPAMIQVSDATVKTEEGSLKRKVVKNWTLHNCNLEAKDEKELKKLIGQIPANDPRVKDIDRAHLLVNVKLIDNLVELGQNVRGVSIFDDVEIKTRRGRSNE